jgi:hypothetical protein
MKGGAQRGHVRPTADVVVRSTTGGRYLCRLEPDRRGWLCGRCEQGVLVAPQIGHLCPVCQAEVIATRSRRSAFWLVLLVLVTLVLGWLVLTWWR